jgi:integrase
MKSYVYNTIGNKKLQELKSVDIQKLYNSLSEKSPISDKPLHPKTIRNIHMNLRAALDKAVEHEVLQKNPAKTVSVPKSSKYKADVYNKEEIEKLFELVKGTDLELAIHILIYLGLRRGELIGLKWSCVDFIKKTVKIIDNAVQIDGRQVIIKAPKSESGKREISIPDSLMLMMKKAYTEYLLRKSVDDDAEDNVIVTEAGKSYKPDWFSLKVRRFMKRHPELRKIRIHDFRHTNATLLLTLGVSPKVASSRLGHADISTTLDIYSHVLESVEQQTADILNEAFSDNKVKLKRG